jgi:hypothetical protein
MYDLNVKELSKEDLLALSEEVFGAITAKNEAEDTEARKKFLKSATALKLKERIKQVQEEYKSLPKSTTVKFEVELHITLKPQYKVDDLLSSGSVYLEDLFAATYKGKIVNAKQLGGQQDLQSALDDVLCDACIDAIDYDKDLSKKANDLVEKVNALVNELDDNCVGCSEVLKVK